MSEDEDEELSNGKGGLGEKPGTGVEIDLLSRLGAVFRRPPNEPRAYSEEFAAAEIVRRPAWRAELEELLAFRKHAQFFPQSLPSLLQKWTETLDRARNQPAQPPNGKRDPNAEAMQRALAKVKVPE